MLQFVPMITKDDKLTYKAAGVDIEQASELVENIKGIAKKNGETRHIGRNWGLWCPL